jgi:Ca2+/H+ antiporter
MVASSGVSTTFIGLIVLPIVGNAAEVWPPVAYLISSM